MGIFSKPIKIEANFRALINSFLCDDLKKPIFSKNYDNYEELRDAFNYSISLDDTILKAKSVYLMQFPNAKVSDFIDWFISNFKHTWLTEFCSDEIRDRNDRVHKAYMNILETIRRTQTWMEEEKLRAKVEVIWEDRGGNYNLLHQTVTLFCDIALGCNQKGEYYISYNLDYRCQEMIGKFFTNTLLRRIYEFTTGDLEPYLKLSNLLYDGMDLFADLLEDSKSDSTIKSFFVPKN